jgi:hypothetical protein
VLDQVAEDGREWWEVHERMVNGCRKVDGGGGLVEQDEEAVSEADGLMVLELGQADTEARAGGRVHKGDLAGVCRVYCRRRRGPPSHEDGSGLPAAWNHTGWRQKLQPDPTKSISTGPP